MALALIVHVRKEDGWEEWALRLEPTTMPIEFERTISPSTSTTSLISLGEPDEGLRAAIPYWIRAILHLLCPLDVERPAPGRSMDRLVPDGIELHTDVVGGAGWTSLVIGGVCTPDPAVPERRPWIVIIRGWREWPVVEGPD
ncbi:hypothetical protein BST61_g6778 [Cercospora zeina]